MSQVENDPDEQALNEAYAYGERCFRDHWWRVSNPFPRGTDARAAWDNGFTDAEEGAS